MRTALEVACVGAQTHWVEEHQSLAPVYCPGNRFHSGPRNTSLRLVRGRREPADGVRAWRQQCLILARILNGTLRSNGCGGVMVAMAWASSSGEASGGRGLALVDGRVLALFHSM